MPAPRVATMICRPPGPASSVQCRVRPLAFGSAGSSCPTMRRFYVQLSHRASHRQVQMAVVVDLGRQARPQSSSAVSNPKNKKKFANAPPPRPSVARIFMAAFKDSFGRLGRAVTGKNYKELFRKHPETFFMAVVVLALTAGVVAYTVKIYFTYFNSEYFTRLPDPVAKSMRKALYYSNYHPDAKLALKYYNLAIQQCVEMKVDPFSDEFMGIRIQVAAWLEKVEQYEKAIEVLQSLLGECKHWVEVMEQAVKDGTAPEYPSAPSGLKPPRKDPAAAAKAGEEEKGTDGGVKDLQGRETIWGKRNRVLRKVVQLNVKLGELYADEHVLDSDLAHERLTYAVETALGEFRRRAKEGSKPGEGAWLSAEEMGATMEELGNSFLARHQAQLAVPLLFQALPLSKDPCHSAVIMNNLAAAFAEHPVQGSTAALLVPSDPPAAVEAKKTPAKGEAPAAAQPPAVSPAEARATYLEYAARWARNASKLATETKGEAHTPECDEACAVSLCNLGDIAKLAGDVGEARRRYQECVDLSKSLSFGAGVKQAEAGLRALSA